MIQIPLKKIQKTYCKRYKKGTRNVKSCEIHTSENSELHNNFIFAKIRCRFFGINTPEKSTSEGVCSKKYVIDRMLEKFFTCRFYGTGTRGRTLVSFIDENGICISTELIEKGLGNPYYGGHK